MGEVSLLIEALEQDETRAQCEALNEAERAIELMKGRE
jgi:hypothetical protein